MTASQRYRQALANCLAAGMTPDAAKRMALKIVRASRIAPTKERNQCPHPPNRLYAWHADTILCVCCNDCGAVLKGGAE